jgi:hypothetical protein
MEQAQFELLRQMYESKYGVVSPESDGTIVALESQLCINLPMDFQSIAKFFSGGMLGGFALHQLYNKSDNQIVADTVMLRGFGNPFEVIVLANDECGMLYLKTDNTIPAVFHTGRMPLPDAILNGEVYQSWNSFSEFFRDMLMNCKT